jgi:hypothetical protein
MSKKNCPKRSSESEVMIVSKSTKFQRFFENVRTVFKISSKIYLDIIHYKKIKWICVEISMMHILHQIRADIYIFNKIFKENKIAQVRSSWSEGHGLATAFCSLSFFLFYAL